MDRPDPRSGTGRGSLPPLAVIGRPVPVTDAHTDRGRRWALAAATAGVLLAAAALAEDDPGGKGRDAAAPAGTIGNRQDISADLAAAQLSLWRLRAEGERLAREGERLDRATTAASRAAAEHGARARTLRRELEGAGARDRPLAAPPSSRHEETDGGDAAAVLTMRRIAALPPAWLLLGPGGGSSLVRGATVLRAAAIELERQAASLRSELGAAAEAAQALEDRRRALAAAVAAAARADAEVQRLRRERDAWRLDVARYQAERAEREPELTAQIDRLGRSRPGAGTAVLGGHPTTGNPDRALRIATVERKPPPPPSPSGNAGAEDAGNAGEDDDGNARRAGSARATAKTDQGPVFPTTGRIVTRFGTMAADRTAHKGLTFAAVPGAEVVAPAAGQVAFAGPFRGYGLLLIVEHANGYHSLLAGLERIEATIGERVDVGETIGAMGRPQVGHPYLYLELRRGGEPINPLPWLTADKRKVRG